MTQFITQQNLRDAGIKLNDSTDADALIEQLNTTLQERVGEEITSSLPEKKLEELLKIQETSNDAIAAEWMSQNVPELEAIVQDEIDILLGELAENSDNINEAK